MLLFAWLITLLLHQLLDTIAATFDVISGFPLRGIGVLDLAPLYDKAVSPDS